MLVTLLSAFLKDVVTVARTEAFFCLSSTARKKQVEGSLGDAYPHAIRDYLTEVSPETFVQDVRALLPLLTSSHGVLGQLIDGARDASLLEYPIDLPVNVAAKAKKEAGDEQTGFSPEFLSDIRAVLQEVTRQSSDTIRKNEFIDAFSAALSEEVAHALDGAPVWKAEGSPTEASVRLKSILERGKGDELTNEIQAFLKDQKGIESPIIQSPIELTAEEKQAMRKSLLTRYPGSVPSFHVESSLAGGVRLFYKGELLDESWMTHVARAFAHLRSSH